MDWRGLEKNDFFQTQVKLLSVVITGFTSGEEVTRPLDLDANFINLP
jgi:hypothetical protein